jgi:hypothetical protein
MRSTLVSYRIEGVLMRFGLWNHGLSLKAMGCLYLLLSLSRLDGWEFSIEGLVALAKAKGMDDGRHSIRTAIAELKAKRFLACQRLRDEDGQLMEMRWMVHDEPMPIDPGLPETIEPMPPVTENPASENLTEVDPLADDGFSVTVTADQAPVRKPVSENRLQQRETTNTPLIGMTNVIPLPPRGESADGQAKPQSTFHQKAVDLWNLCAPAHWVRIRDIGQQRQRRLNGLIREFGNATKALAALEQSLAMAHHEDWAMKPAARLTIENWLSNGKVRQYQEKHQAQQEPVDAVLSGEQQEIAALAAQHSRLFDGVVLQEGSLHLRYSTAVQQQAGYPAHALVSTISALEAEIRHLNQRLAPVPCPLT